MITSRPTGARTLGVLDPCPRVERNFIVKGRVAGSGLPMIPRGGDDVLDSPTAPARAGGTAAAAVIPRSGPGAEQARTRARRSPSSPTRAPTNRRSASTSSVLFEQRTGAQVVLDPGWWDMLPKLKASPPGQPVFDPVMTDPTQGQPSIKDGLFQRFALESVRTRGSVVPNLQETRSKNLSGHKLRRLRSS